MLEITPSDIAALADDDLRTLIGMLCEVELRKRGLCESCVTWGGHQDAPDGGIDVRVNLGAGVGIAGFIPGAATGFQIKRPDMPPTAIRSEMRPNGVLRSAIQDLAVSRGAYVIVSSGASVSDSVLAARVQAMTDCVPEIEPPAALVLDFYDQTKIATWVRANPGLIPWTRTKAGRQISGWQTYGSWTGTERSSEFLTDAHCRIFVGQARDGGGVTTIDGINRMRASLASGGGVVRLVGLSGVGKTRLVEALFDYRVGETSLDASLAMYTNTSDAPDPGPVSIVSDLAAGGTRAIVVVDNCPSDLHRRLTETCKGTSVSVITVEYDIREDQPHGTEVFWLESSSAEMTEALLKSRFPRVSQVDRGRLATIAGGNFRVALALAGIVDSGVEASSLTDDELFTRLFDQRNDRDAGLLRAAQACSLLYSFDGEDVAQNGELARIGALIGQDAAALYAHVAELQRRDLAQARSVWRAVLPHAVANRLARSALQNIPIETVEASFAGDAPERVRISFSRRLGYLHTDPQAKVLVRLWFAIDGALGAPADFDDVEAQMFKNIAPVEPEAALAVLERVVAAGEARRLIDSQHQYERLLRSLAYDAALFERSANVLLALALASSTHEKSKAADAFRSLFFVFFSGTHATVEQRIAFVERLLRSSSDRDRGLGLSALTNLLEASHFTSLYDFEFGTRSRNYGYRLEPDGLRAWYAAVLRSAESIATGAVPAAKETAAAIALAFRGLWAHAHMFEDLERVAKAISTGGYWREGWLATRQTLTYSGKGLSDESKSRLIALERELRPTNLVERVQSVVIGPRRGRISLEEYEDDDEDISQGLKKTTELAERLGEEVANDSAAFTELLPELFVATNSIINFASGLGRVAHVPAATWKALRSAYVNNTSSNKQPQALFGFLQGVHQANPEVANGILDEAVADSALGPIYPLLQCAVPIGSVGVARMSRAIDAEVAPIENYRRIAWGQAHASIVGDDLSVFLNKLGGDPKGVGPALEILFFRFFGNGGAAASPEPEIIAVGRDLLALMPFDQIDDRDDGHLELIVRRCLAGADGADAAKKICDRLRGFIIEGGDIEKYDDFIGALCETQPFIVLDALLAGEPDCLIKMKREAGLKDKYRRNPFTVLPTQALEGWCGQDPQARAVALAGIVPFMTKDEEGQVTSEWSDQALTLIKLAPNKSEVLKVFVERFRPSSWSGSRASILQSRLSLLEELRKHPDPALAGHALSAAVNLTSDIEKERAWEAKYNHSHDERFE